MKTAKMIKMSDAITAGLQATFGSNDKYRMVQKPRGQHHKMTVYLHDKVMGTVSISPYRFVWWSKNRKMNKVLKSIMKDFKTKGGDRVSSGIT